jgi:hypothetical protein
MTTARAWVGHGRGGSLPDFGDVDADLLDLGELGEDPVRQFATQAALLHPAERGELVPVVVRLVDEDGPAADPLAQEERGSKVAREGGSLEPVWSVVRDLDRLVDRVSNVMIGATGPKVSSLRQKEVGVTPSMTAGSK